MADADGTLPTQAKRMILSPGGGRRIYCPMSPIGYFQKSQLYLPGVRDDPAEVKPIGSPRGVQAGRNAGEEVLIDARSGRRTAGHRKRACPCP